MKKNILFFLLSACLLITGHINAQTKSAYISVDNLVSIMPETARVDSLVERYQIDSITPMYNETLAIYQSQLNIYNDSLHTTATVHKNAENQLTTLLYQIQNWEQIQNQSMESKRSALLDPVYRKAYEAIKQVAKEKGYAHVFNKEAYLVAPDDEDLIIAVAAKLKIAIPKSTRVGSKY